MITRSIEVSRASLKVKIAALAASIAVAAGIMVAPQPAQAWEPGADDPGYEVGQLVTHDWAGSAPYWNNITVGRMYLDRSSWVAGTRLKLTTVIDLSHPALKPQQCSASDPKKWAGLNTLRFTFTADNQTDFHISDIVNPQTLLDRRPMIDAGYNAATNKNGIQWAYITNAIGHPDGGEYLGETLRAGVYSFTFVAPVGSDLLKPSTFHQQIRPWVNVSLNSNPAQDPNSPFPNSPSGCAASSVIQIIKPGSLQAFGSSAINAISNSVIWGAKPSVVATVTSAEGVPTGEVTVTGPYGIKGQGAIVQKGSAGQAVVSLPATLPVGVHKLTVTYGGQGQHSGATTTVSLVVSKRKPSLAVKVTKKSKPKKTGKARLTVSSPLPTKPSGKVTVTLKKGRKAKSVTGTLRSGTITVTLPKLPKGKWTVTAVYLGDAHYAAVTATAPKINSK